MDGKNLQVSTLLDFYGNMLTEKQRDLVELYYNEDLSLSEIAELKKITRQGVRDGIKRGEAFLFELEEKLRLAQRFYQMEQALEQMRQLAQEAYEINDRYKYSIELEKRLKMIYRLASSLSEDAE